jgi:glutamate/aspartate transport system permease protein
MELTARSRAMQEFSFQVFEAFAAATVIYLIVNLLVVLAMRKVESKVRVHGYIGTPNQTITPGH